MSTAPKACLVVDLDGTLTPTDTLAESVVRLLRRSPLTAIALFLRLFEGRAAFKRAVAARSSFSAEGLPYHEPVLAFLRMERKKGRQIVLATATHKSIADAVSAHLGLFDDVLATGEGQNLKGRTKLQAIQQRVGDQFVYVGDSRADIPIWKAAKAAVLVGVSSRVADSVRSVTPIEREFPKEHGGIAVWLRALRVHQWVKNLLLLVPLLTSFSFLDASKLITITLAFLAFSLAASATYILNDLWDLDSDRAHPKKRFRPLANAEIPIPRSILVAGAALAAAIAIAATVSKHFALMLLLYLVATSAYSWVLKAYVLIDVVTLSLLYTLRILAGSVAIGVATSSWLLAFSVFMFFSLALVKRCSELIALDKLGMRTASGRDYRVTDLVVLWPLGVGAALSAVVVFGLFISVPETQARYQSPQMLWLVAVGLIYWLARLWIKTSRGEMHDDPVIYAMKDRGSRLVVLAMVAVTVVAHSSTLGGVP